MDPLKEFDLRIPFLGSTFSGFSSTSNELDLSKSPKDLGGSLIGGILAALLVLAGVLNSGFLQREKGLGGRKLLSMPRLFLSTRSLKVSPFSILCPFLTAQQSK